MSKSQGGAWKEGDLVATYLSGVRAAIPLAAEQIDVESLIGARYSLDEGLDGLARAGETGMLKVLLKMDEG